MIKIQNKKTVVMAFIVLAVLLAVIVLLVFPAMRDIKRLNNEILARRIELERLYLQGQNIRRVTEDLERVAHELPRMKASLPRAGEELEFITTLEGIASRNRLGSRLEFVTRNDIPAVSQLLPSAFEIKLAGSFSGLYQYLSELDRLPYYVFIQSLAIHGGVGQDTSIRWGGMGSAPASLASLQSRSGPNPSLGGPDFPPGGESSRAVSATLQGYLYWKK